MARLASLAVLLAVFVATPWQGNAQCRLCAAPTTSAEVKANPPIRLEIETSLNFDRLVLFGSGEGSAVVRPDGSSVATGALADVGARAMVGTATIHGEPGRTVRIELPR